MKIISFICVQNEFTPNRNSNNRESPWIRCLSKLHTWQAQTTTKIIFLHPPSNYSGTTEFISYENRNKKQTNRLSCVNGVSPFYIRQHALFKLNSALEMKAFVFRKNIPQRKIAFPVGWMQRVLSDVYLPFRIETRMWKTLFEKIWSCSFQTQIKHQQNSCYVFSISIYIFREYVPHIKFLENWK